RPHRHISHVSSSSTASDSATLNAPGPPRPIPPSSGSPPGSEPPRFMPGPAPTSVPSHSGPVPPADGRSPFIPRPADSPIGTKDTKPHKLSRAGTAGAALDSNTGGRKKGFSGFAVSFL